MASESRSNSISRSRRRTRSCDQTRSGRLVILVQIVSWCSVGGLLVLRGITTLSNDTDDNPLEVNSTSAVSGTTSSSEEDQDAKNTTSAGAASVQQNSTSPPTPQRTGVKINPSSAILITIGTTMLVIGPTLLLARILDSRRADRDGVKFSKVDPPPSYDDVVDRAPRYSSLFQVTESGELVPITGTNCTSVPV